MTSFNTRGLYVPMYLSRNSETWLVADYEPDETTTPTFVGTLTFKVGATITVAALEIQPGTGEVKYRIPPITVTTMPNLGGWYNLVMTPAGSTPKEIVYGPVEVR
jgi:hypothetical protein